MKLISAMILGVLVCIAMPASAQANPDSVKLRNDCRLYRQILLTGQPAPHRAEALERLGLCPDAMAIAADWLTSLSGASDPGQFADLQGDIAGVRDGILFARAFAIAQDRSATPTARVVALTIVLDQQGIMWSTDFSVMTSKGSYCALGRLTGVVIRVGNALPPDYFDRSIALAAAIGADSTESPMVRSAAQCVSKYLGYRKTIDRDVQPPL